MAKNSSKLAGKIFPDAFKRADEIKQLPLAQLDQSIKELVKLGECVEILSGFAFKSDLFNTEKNGMPLIRIRDVVPAKTETYYSGDYLDDYLINNDDLLIGMDGDFNREKWQGGKALLNQRVCKISAVPSILNQDYLYHFLPKALLKIHSETPAVTVKHLSVKTIKEIEIPIPPLAEQKRLAAILDKADAIRRKRQQAIELADEFLRSVFLDMFGDPVTNPKGWILEPLGQWLEKIDSGWSPICMDRSATQDEWGILKLGAITQCKYDDSQNKALPPKNQPRLELEVKTGDLLFSRKNTYDLVAAVAYVHETKSKLMLPDLIFRLCISPYSQINSKFLWQLLIQTNQRKEIQKLAGGAAGSMPNISKKKLETVNLIKPPLKLQEKFAEIVEFVEAQKNRLQAHLTEANTLFASLQQRAFAGEL